MTQRYRAIDSGDFEPRIRALEEMLGGEQESTGGIIDCAGMGMSPSADAVTNGTILREAVALGVSTKKAVYLPGAPAPYVCAPVTTGTYLATATGVTGLTIFGAGMGVTRLQSVAGMDTGFLNFTNCSRIIVRDLSVDLNRASRPSLVKPHGIRFDKGDDVEISHVELIDPMSYGIGFEGTSSGENSTRIILAYNRIYRSGIDGIDIKNPTPNTNQSWVITGNYIEDHDYGRPDNDGAGIDCRAPALVTSNEVRFTNSLSNGVGMRSRVPDGGTGTPGGGKKTRFIGNKVIATSTYVTTYGTAGINAEDDYTCAVGNYTENIDQAFGVSGRGTQFIGNTTLNPVRGFFCYQHTSDAIVADNIVINPSLEGIRLDGCTNLTLRGNKVVGDGRAGTTGLVESAISPGSKAFENEISGMETDVTGFSSFAYLADNNVGAWPRSGSSPIAGITTVNMGGPVARKTVFTFTNVHLPLVDVPGTVAYGSLRIFDFPAGVVCVSGMVADLVITKSSAGVIATWDGDFGTGTLPAGADATLASFEQNFINTTPTPQAVAGATTAKGWLRTQSILDGSTGNAVDIYFNMLVDDADHDVTTTPCDLIINGMLTVTWTNTGGLLVAVLRTDINADTDIARPSVVAPTDVGGAALLTGEANGFAVDFTYATDASRVAVKASSVVTSYALDSFLTNAGTSPKQVYDVTGALVWAPHNMFLRSEDFTTSWTLSGTPVVTAHTLEDNSAATQAIISQNLAAIVGATYTATAWFAKDAVTTRFPAFSVVGVTVFTTQLNTSTGQIINSTTTLSGSSLVEDTGTHWKVKITYVADQTPMSLRLYPSYATTLGGGSSVTPVGVVTVDKVQLNRGSTPTAYLTTTAAARYGLAVDYDPVTHVSKGLLCEAAATNVLTISLQFDAASWAKTGITVTANAIAAPDGMLTADKVTEAAGASPFNVAQTGLTATTGTFSVYAKAGERTQIMLHDSTSAKGDGFNLSNGTTFVSAGITTTGAPVIQNVGNGWYRCSIATVAATAVRIYIDNGGTHTYTGDGVSGLYVWGAQLETGAVATSPIPTFAASVTRAADQYNCTPASINHSATAGSWWVEFSTVVSQNGGRIIGYASTTAPLYCNTNVAIFLADTGTLSKPVSAWNTGLPRRAASAFQSADRAVTADGLAVASDAGVTTVLLSPGATINFGNLAAGNASLNGWLRKLFYLPRRMTNTELVTKTT